MPRPGHSAYRHAGPRADTSDRGIHYSQRKAVSFGKLSEPAGERPGSEMDPGFRRDDGGRSRQSGYLLLPVAVAIALIGAIAFLISSESAIEVDMTAGELDAARAEYVAQAGLQHALREHAQQGCGPYADLTNVAFGSDEYNTKLTHDLGGTAAYTVNIDQDTWIRDDQPTNNYATDAKMHIRNEGGVIERPLLRYDLSTIPAKADILSARAWFYVNKEHSEGPVDIHLITADWTDTDATWDSMGANLGSKVVASVPTEPGSGVWVSVNLTAQVQAWVNGESNYGITINTDSAGVHSEYLSNESAFPPYIEVLVGNPPTSPAKLKVTSKIDGGGAALVMRDDVSLRQSPLSYTRLSLDVGTGQDAMIDSFYNTRNYGDHALDLDSVGTLEHSLIQFNVLTVPQGARILSAQLELYHTATAGTPVDPGVAVHRVTREWVEGTKAGSGTADGVTWETWDGTISWTQSGGDYDVSPVASSDISAAINDWESWDISELVQGWVSGIYPNHGLLLKGTGDVEVTFASKEDADPSLRPRLAVSYSCRCGEVCAAPQGSGKIALIGDDATPDPNDQIKIPIIESWGYDVDFYQDQDSNTIIWNNYDLVYVSETIISGDVSANLANVPIGVVNEEPKLYDDLQLANGDTDHVGSSIDIVNNSHFITAVFPQGALSIYTGDMEILTADTPLAPDLQTLGEFGGAATLTAIEKGAATTSGTAAGRRVTLPLGQHSAADFDWSKLNNNGYLLVQRAIEWGMDKKGPAVGQLLLVVVNPGSLTTQESAKKTLFESWGYAVNLIDESDSQSNFDTALAANDVVYITEDVSSGNVNTKLVNAAIGVVTEEDNLSDEFGMAASIAWESGTQVDINDNSHYITAPFSIGLLSIVTANESLAYVTGTQSPDLGRLASSTSGYGVVTLEAGDAMFGGGSAAGRRAQLPWGGDNFDVNHLNADGLTILQRALEWGAGAQNPDYSTELLFVVADPLALTGAESAKKSLIESWGYTVNLIDDADSAVNFFNAYAVNNVVYVSGEVSDSAIGTKLIKVPIGIVNEQIALHDELLLSTSAGTNDFNRVFVINNTHYITEGINTGWNTIATTDQPLNALEGTLAPGMTNLAEVWISGANYDYGLAVVDTGGQLNTGEFAAGRRVQLPWGTAGFDFSTLNAKGQDLMKRAIEWAGGSEIDMSPLAHWKLDDAVGMTAIDSVGGNDATLNGDPAWTTGTLDGALEFDGSGDYTTTDNNFTPPPMGTVLFWMKVPGSPGSQGRILGLDDTWEIRHVTTGTPDGIPYGLVFDLGVTGVNTEFVTTVTTDTPDQWYFVAATYDTNSDAYQVYLDGALHKSGTYPSSLTVPAAAPLSLGTRTGSSNYFIGTLDDVQIYDRILSASEIADFYAAGAPPAPGYTETYEPWTASASDSWETVSLATFGVLPNAVVEVAVINDSGNRERWGGVRAVGSTLDRRLRLQEAEAGGIDVVTMHVQADAGSQIQHYSDATGDVSFILLGYWTGASYVELFETFSAATSNSWVSEDVSDEGLGANQVAEVVIVNTDTGAERLAGVRPVGATYQRRFMLHEAEAGGVDAVTMMVTTNDDAEVEAYASNAGDVDFYVIGYWGTPPGTYTATGGSHGQVSAPINWETIDLTSYGVPADSIAQFVLANENQGDENSMRVREVGSTINNRALLLHEAEAGGSDLGSLHANVDASSQVQWAAAQDPTNGYFYPVGWWVLSP